MERSEVDAGPLALLVHGLAHAISKSWEEEGKANASVASVVQEGTTSIAVLQHSEVFAAGATSTTSNAPVATPAATPTTTPPATTDSAAATALAAAAAAAAAAATPADLSMQEFNPAAADAAAVSPDGLSLHSEAGYASTTSHFSRGGYTSEASATFRTALAREQLAEELAILRRSHAAEMSVKAPATPDTPSRRVHRQPGVGRVHRQLGVGCGRYLKFLATSWDAMLFESITEVITCVLRVEDSSKAPNSES